MKNVFFFVAVVAALTSCTNNPCCETTVEPAVAVDSVVEVVDTVAVEAPVAKEAAQAVK